MSQVVLLAAPCGGGKTTACQRFVALAHEAGLRVGGILALSRDDDVGERVGIIAQDVFTREERALATLGLGGECTVGRYRFDPEALAWSLERLTIALGVPLDAVLLDEIGPLELKRNGGYAPILEALPLAQARVVILLVRAELLTCLQERLRALHPLTVTLTLANRDQLPQHLLEITWGAVAAS